VLFIIILLGAGLRIYNLGEKSFDRDEFFELNSSYGYFKTGTWVAWDFGNEKPFEASLQDKTSTERAEIYRWQIAQLYRFFEPSETVTRSISAFWGIISIALIYFVTLYFTKNHGIALLAAFLTAIGESGMIYSRRLRMYSMLFPAYLIFSWLVYKFYEAKYEGKNKLFEFFSDKFKVNLLYFLPALIAGLISYNVHMLTASIVATITAFSIFSWLWWERKEKINKYSITLALIFIAYLFISLIPQLAKFYKSFKKQVELFKFNPDYFIDYFTDFNFFILGFILMIFGVWYLAKKMEKKKEALFLFLSAIVPLIFAIFTWVRFPAQRYIYFVQSFGIILIAVGIYAVLCYLNIYLKNRKIILVPFFILMLILLIDFSYFKKENQIYAHTKNSFYPNFRNIFPYILKNKKESDVFITRSYRSYYWLGDKVKVFDLQALPFEKKDCGKIVSEAIVENKSGWFILPDIDEGFICKEGRDYLGNNYKKIENENIPNTVSIYRWGE